MEGQLLLAEGDSGWLYSATEGKRSLGDLYPFDLSPEGSTVLAARSEQEASGITRDTELVIIDTTSLAEEVIVVAGDREDFGPARWSPDGSLIAYRVTTYDVDPSESHPGGAATESVCVRASSDAASRCFDPPRPVDAIVWSSDGKSLLIAGPGSEPVFRLDVNTGASEIVMSLEDEMLRAELERNGYGRARQFVRPESSASGRYIATLVSVRGGNRTYAPAIFTSAGAFVSLGEASGEFPDAFAWAPEHDLLAYTQGEAPYAITELYVHDPARETDRSAATTKDEGPMIPRIDGVAWSPDGRWIAFSRPKGVRVVDADGEQPPRELDVDGTIVAWEREPRAVDDSSPSPMSSPSEDPKESDGYIGFYPPSHVEDGMIVMPLTFVDGSGGEVVAPSDFGVQNMSAAIYTSGGLGGVDRTMDFRYKNGSSFMYEGPLETYESANGSRVELWNPVPETPFECPNLVFRFGHWYVGVRACQDHLIDSDKAQWAKLMEGAVSEEGFPILSATSPLQLQETGGHEGPQMYLGMDQANWIQLVPGECDPKSYAHDGDIQEMPDGTRVSFNRLEDGNSGIKYDWFVRWCEDGLIGIQVEYAYEAFARRAAEDFRLRNIVLAD